MPYMLQLALTDQDRQSSDDESQPGPSESTNAENGFDSASAVNPTIAPNLSAVDPKAIVRAVYQAYRMLELAVMMSYDSHTSRQLNERYEEVSQWWIDCC
jgi:hypothetical protein